MATLTKLGMTNLHYELITDVQNFRQKSSHDIKGQDFLTAWIADHPTFAAKEAVNAFRADGRHEAGAYTALRALTEEGVLKKLSPGNYSRTDVKAIAAPAKKAKATKSKAKAKGATKKKSAGTHLDFIERIGRRHKGGEFTSIRVKELFEKDGRPVSSVDPTLRAMAEKGTIKHTGKGEWKIATMNGTAVEGSAHG
jgi:ribosomal protein S25